MKVCFQIEGEWFTDLIRSRFWDEDCGLDKALKLIKESLTEDITEQMCIELIEGRKKFVGINTFDFVDDNEEIRPITKYIRKKELEIKIKEIEDYICKFPGKYIDTYACTTSKCWFNREKFDSIEALYEELVYNRSSSEGPLENGCKWIMAPYQTAKMLASYFEKNQINEDVFTRFIKIVKNTRDFSRGMNRQGLMTMLQSIY